MLKMFSLFCIHFGLKLRRIEFMGQSLKCGFGNEIWVYLLRTAVHYKPYLGNSMKMVEENYENEKSNGIQFN